MDLDIVRVLRSVPPKHEQASLIPLTTPFGDALNPEAPLPEHPRPSFAREHWLSLNGNTWEYAIVPGDGSSRAWRTAAPPAAFDGSIVVPFSPEAPLSGVGRTLMPGELLWYRRVFHAPLWHERDQAILHFDGVDHACAVYLNGTKVAEHEGAYLPFSADVSSCVFEEENELLVCVSDPSETGSQLRGKQRLDRGDMWYTAQSGIWQSVWLELVPRTRLADLRLAPAPDEGRLRVTAWFEVAANDAPPEFALELLHADGAPVAHASVHPAEGVGVAAFSLDVPQPRLWSPEDPYLYQVRATFGIDRVSSYVAFRTTTVEPDASGVPRFCLNHRPLFLRGLLDQGSWPDGLLTPPSDEAMEHDLCSARDAGFNLVRKHLKVESDRWYYLCDRLGMLVWQDMPSGGGELSAWHVRDKPTLFRRSWAAMRDDTPRAWEKLAAGSKAYRDEWLLTCRDVVVRLSGHPCVVGWTAFNEGWGQFGARKATELIHELDATRPVLSASGWYDQGCGEVQGIHNYFRKMRVFPDPFARRGGRRAQLLSEFGGLTFRVDGHACLDRVYGYDAYDTLEAWRTALEALLARVDELEGQGLSGFVYTQLTDVEEEANGILTYDRRVNKLKR